MGEAKRKLKQQVEKMVDDLQQAMLVFSEDEKDMIHNTFGQGFDTLNILRRFLLGGNLNDGEENILQGIAKSDIITLLKKLLLPEINPDAPMGATTDVFSNINLQEKSLDYAYYDMCAMDIMKDFITQRMELLETGKITGQVMNIKDLSFNKTKEKEKAFIEQLALHCIYKYINALITKLFGVASQFEETPKEQAERLLKDSSK